MIDSDSSGDYRYPVSQITDQDDAASGITPSQTVGPYVHIGLLNEGSETLVTGDDPEAIELSITVVDGAGKYIKDAMVELWQARADGTFNAPNDPRTAAAATEQGFRGLGRGFCDDNGRVTFRTVVPGALPGQAPHINVGIFARGMLERLITRVYFPQHAGWHAADPVLTSVDKPRRSLLVAEETDAGYAWTVHVQHPDAGLETPFFHL
ncbi:protocatechuate 3,4-dioxygenase subunit alpha [Corynebacterium yudongzhengii]|uniref:Protocatechuate 3,4-dioxygenase subunit alpha n=1 Tax=Corynebacterium yudongzhengii TaxID=2080740 RepID=A0A2U1T8Z2_9CORY|nr:protocatechuate 3,4-dioxygenase subunit alpha [Corynebacterium yudongzhengii]AWB82492.1 protocatechuate 3,4-dioxygenase subunit alpha [Corynebacterium yudongzhengii]PWC02452.1 protocatechuate 3,4-dioxygenase subunit alpha [Corynebacterium yudongzhengii]